jgi:hypothetical protein
MEIQTNANGEVGTIINQYESINDAESKFHQILAAASISEVPVHTSIVLTDEGVTLRAESYKHIDGSTTHEIPSM